MKRGARTYILEQDEHLENLRKIIKRDYFSDGQQSAANGSLNKYLANFTSKENKLFSEMVHADRQIWKKEHWWIDKEKQIKMITNSGKQFQNMLEGDRDQNGIDVSIVKQKGQNEIFFKQQDGYSTYLTQDQQAAKKIIYTNCRFNNSFTLPKIQQKQQQPIITWGEVQSTPIRLNGPEYRIPETPIRDQLLGQLNQKINTSKKQQGKKKSELVMRILGTVTPARSSIRGPNSSVRRQESIQRSQKNQIDNMMEGLLKVKK